MIELRHLDDVIGGGDLIPLVRHELTEAERVVNDSSYSDDTGRRPLTVVGEQAQLAPWVASDARQSTEAEQVYLSGVSAAQDAGNRALAGQLLSSMSYQMANVGDPPMPLYSPAPPSRATTGPPRLCARSCSNGSHGQAPARATPTAPRALDAVGDADEARAPGDAEPEWVYWLDRKEIDVMSGR
ncbi:hypothetical protein [Amycolatopsis tucumanensis]|uniref:Uncharacterized protein n=1 Tax=Amycolatopsis tucumanensis TaxID=401106 RepID=A0ABP7JWS3_9PSEU|nr:hypothetical protein [Amycolatopsis tucumanensis]MCF6428492.1 hypothetical protein [Amycolatopsis tucumanensis]